MFKSQVWNLVGNNDILKGQKYIVLFYFFLYHIIFLYHLITWIRLKSQRRKIMLLIDELRTEYNKLETVMNDLEAIKSQVKKALENGQYIVYSHCQEQVKMSIKLDKEFDCLLENTELAIKTLVATTNEVCGGNTFVAVDSTQVICVVKQFYPTDRLDLPFHKTMLTDIIEFTKFHLKNEMLEKARSGFSEGEIKLGEKAMDITVYSDIIFKKLSEYYAQQGIKVQFGMLLSDPIYFNWDPKKEEN
jgi:hypothetical protein